MSASVPEGTSSEQVQEMVQAAVAAAAGESGVSQEDLQAIVAQAVAAAVSGLCGPSHSGCDAH